MPGRMKGKRESSDYNVGLRPGTREKEGRRPRGVASDHRAALKASPGQLWEPQNEDCL